MIWSALGDVLPEAFGIAISPLPIVLVILMLVSARARVTGPSFFAGWVLGVTVVVGIGFLLAEGADAATDADASDGVLVGKVLFGLFFLAMAVKQWRGRPQPGDQPTTPKLFATVDTLGAGKAVGLGFVFCVANPKNLPLALSAGAGIARAGVTGTDGLITILLFAMVAAASVAAPVIVYFAFGDRSDAILQSWKVWLITNNSTVMVVLFSVLGAKLLGDGLGLFS
jgi:hypothetical protein